MQADQSAGCYLDSTESEGTFSRWGSHSMIYIALNTVHIFILKVLGPVIQSVVSLTSSLRVISLTVLADSIYNILIFFAEKM